MSLTDDNVDAATTPHYGTAPGNVGTSAVDVRHEEVRRLLSDYQEDTLPPPEGETVRKHLERCDPCRVFADTLRGTVDVLGSLPRQSMPERLKRRLLDQVHAQPSERR